MKKILLSAIALLSVVSISAQDVKSTFDAAVAAFNSKQYLEAAQGLETVIKTAGAAPEHASSVATAKTYLPQSYFRLGGSNAMKKNYEDARKYFSKAAETAELYDDIPTMTKSNTWIGKTYELQGGAAFNAKDYATALPVFESGYAADPRNAKMANWLGACYCETGEFEKGMSIFEKVAKMGSNPKYAAEAAQAENNMVIYTNNRVADLQKSKNYDGVIAMADALTAKNPNNATAAKIRLQAYSDKKDYAKVFATAEAAAALQTSAEEKSNIYFILGAAYNAKEMKADAITAFKKVTAGANAATAASTVVELSK